MSLRQHVINVGVLIMSATFSLGLCEFGTRVFLRPANYLSVEMVKDDVLGATPSAATRFSGFDAWGFRNPRVPDTTDIVAIGDSHTYGNTATMEDSWPYVLGRLTHEAVYNMGLGGYGPNQYYHVLKTRALSLKPRTIIVGFYMGDDFENAFLITYGLDHWAYLRTINPGQVNFDIWEAPAAPTWHKKIRVWLSRHSVTYQLLIHGPLFGRFQGEVQIQNALRLSNSATLLNVPEQNIAEVFLPVEIFRRNNLESPSVREGMRITFKLFEEMNEICRENHIQFLVTVIPTKEMVFSKYLEHNRQVALSDVLDHLIANERLERKAAFDFLAGSHISYVDTLPALQQAVGNKIYARLATDMHPNKEGYRVIGEAVAEALKKNVAGN